MIPLPPVVPCEELAEISYDCAAPSTRCVGDIEGSEYDTPTEADWDARPGDVVIVAPGLYEGLVLRSSGRCDAYDDYTCNSERPITWRGLDGAILDRGLLVYADYVTIEGFTIQGHSSTLSSGIELHNADGANIRCNTIHGNTLDGIEAWDTWDLLVSRNRVHANGRNGVSLFRVSGVEIVNNVISANRANGIRSYWGSSGMSFSFNTIDARLSGIKIIEGVHELGSARTAGNLVYAEEDAAYLLEEVEDIPDLVVEDPPRIWRDRDAGDYRLSDDSEARGLLSNDQLPVPLLEDLVGERPEGELDAGALSWVCVRLAEDDPCNGIDDNCDGRVDEDPVPADKDGDGVAKGSTVCDPNDLPEVTAEGDCDDKNPKSRRCSLRFSGGCSTAPAGLPPLLAWLVAAAVGRGRMRLK